MVRVIIVPASDLSRFPGMGVLARGETIVALGGSTFKERTRSAFDDEDAFLEAVAHGNADLYTFSTIGDATVFASKKVKALADQAKAFMSILEDAVDTSRKVMPIAVSAGSRRHKRA